VLAGGFGSFRLSSGLPVAERADEPAGLGAVEHDGRRLAVPVGAEPDERGWSGSARFLLSPPITTGWESDG
jgi:hypothetical protein